ncbi:MAG: ATP-binding protein [Bacteroidetes bacterium]|nr:ATP-binding protein [Bacteroidota bacterium]
MKQKINNILESFQFDKGLDVDVDEGYPKIITSQFGGDPGKGFKELIQNHIDSYSSDIPMEERKGEIVTGNNTISITDYGTGLSLDKLKLLLTLGGTDKDKDSSKIGMFGIGFFSIFNPGLYTKKVVVTTLCEKQVVEMTFTITDPNRKPKIDIQILKKEINYSTRIEVWFDRNASVDKCLHYAEKSLRYYPCKMTINGAPFQSIWEDAKRQGLKIYNEGPVSGFLERSGWYEHITVLCKYEYIKSIDLSIFPKGGHGICSDLRDFEAKGIPYIKGYNASINNNNLRLTISRDSYYLDYNFDYSIGLLRKMMMDKLNDHLNRSFDSQVILANQYILRYPIRDYLADPEKYDSKDPIKNAVVKSLAKAKVYKLSDKYELMSLEEMKHSLTEGIPLFYSERLKNLRWLGGAFKHDFIVIPEPCLTFHGAPDFYKSIFSIIFKDIVDLDYIQNDNKMISELVERKIVSKSALTPLCKFVGEKKLDREQFELIIEINEILRNKDVKEAISNNIRISVRNIQATFFEVKEEGAYISTGLFNQQGQPLSEDYVSNFVSIEGEKTKKQDVMGTDILLGLRLNHPFIEFLVNSKNEHKAYYTLTYIAHELALCQKLLVPYSPFYHFVKEKTVAAMRKALIKQMLSERQS